MPSPKLLKWIRDKHSKAQFEVVDLAKVLAWYKQGTKSKTDQKLEKFLEKVILLFPHLRIPYFSPPSPFSTEMESPLVTLPVPMSYLGHNVVPLNVFIVEAQLT